MRPLLWEDYGRTLAKVQMDADEGSRLVEELREQLVSGSYLSGWSDPLQECTVWQGMLKLVDEKAKLLKTKLDYAKSRFSTLPGY